MIAFLRGSSSGFENMPLPWPHRGDTTQPGRHLTKRNYLGLIPEGKCAQAQNRAFVNNSCRLLNALDPSKVFI